MKRPSRRTFLKRAAAIGSVSTVPYFYSCGKAWSAESTAPSDLPVVGCIGMGTRGMGLIGEARKYARIAAVCDVDDRHARQALPWAGDKARTYDDYRHLLDRADIQAVLIATPDHWHAKIAVE